MDNLIQSFKAPALFVVLVILTLLSQIAMGQTVIDVNSDADVSSDDGSCTLREAIAAANSNTASGAMADECPAGSGVAADTIRFDINGGGSAETISPAGTLPSIAEAVYIDGFSQGCGGGPCILIDGSSAGAANGITLDLGGAGSTIRGLVINGFNGTGIIIHGDDNTILGNYIGTNLAGNAAAANVFGGIVVNNASGNVIGGTTTEARNLISGNGNPGVTLQGASPGSTNNRVEGNYIGTDLTGMSAVANNSGVSIVGTSSSNVIGGSEPGAGNVISGNSNAGIFINGSADNRIEGNLIGTTANGGAALSNGGHGVSFSNNASNNVVGGTDPSAGNVISGNGQHGVFLILTVGNRIEGNLIGTDLSGTSGIPNGGSGVHFEPGANSNVVGGTASGTANIIAFNTDHGVGIDGSLGAGIENAILGNSFFRNSTLGIDLGLDGILNDDADDPDEGPNRRQNRPEFLNPPSYNSGANQLTVTYFVDTDPANAAYPLRIEFFIADIDMEEGETFIGSDVYAEADFQNGGKLLVFSPLSPVAASKSTEAALMAVEDGVVATATDDDGNTSEFEFSEVGIALPVEFVSFGVVVDERDAVLTWQTASEEDNAGFEIEHARGDARPGETPSARWEQVGFVEGHGTTTEPHHYHHRVVDLSSGTHSFRLKQVDFDGAFEYSPVIEVVVDIPSGVVIDGPYPNPFNSTATIQFAVEVEQDVEVALIDILGRRVQTLFSSRMPAHRPQSVRINRDDLTNGIYAVRVQGTGFVETRGVVVLR